MLSLASRLKFSSSTSDHKRSESETSEISRKTQTESGIQDFWSNDHPDAADGLVVAVPERAAAATPPHLQHHRTIRPPTHTVSSFSYNHNLNLSHADTQYSHCSNSSPPSRPPLITNFSKPSIYPQEPNNPTQIALEDPITDLDISPSSPASPASPTTPSPLKERFSFFAGLRTNSHDGLSSPKSTLSSGRNSPTRENRTSKGLATWFQGESAPINLGVTQLPSPSKDLPNPLETAPSLLPPSANMLSRRNTTAASHSKSASTSSTSSSGPFSLFRSLTSNKSSPTPSYSSGPEDPLLSLDPTTALLPESNNPFSPAAFKNLQQKAEGLLSQLHTAYRARTLEASEARQESSALREELDEAKTRAANFQAQLEDLGARNVEQCEAIARLGEELARERGKGRREREAERSVRLVRESGRRVRKSNASVSPSLVSDSGFESNDEEGSLRSEMGDEGGEEEGMVGTPTAVGNTTTVYGTRCVNCEGRDGNTAWARGSRETQFVGSRDVVGDIDAALEMVEDALMGLR